MNENKENGKESKWNFAIAARSPIEKNRQACLTAVLLSMVVTSQYDAL